MTTLDRQRPSLPMRCPPASELARAAQALHDGEPAAADAAALFVHAESCARCGQTLRLESRFLAVLCTRLRGTPGTGAPAAVHARVRARLRGPAGAHAYLRA